ncbi:hypothetical protein AGMMS49942_09980 [Spirochaetia bacterium]|nr:hypothetical protein AGMMS49942_09980 [Spirochaetia bacterium]
MKLITLLAVVALFFASCGSAPSSDGSGGGAVGRSSASKKTAVQKKEAVKFANGDLDEYTVSEYDPSDITLLNQTRHSASSYIMDETEFIYNEGSRMLTTKVTKDDEKRLKTRVVYEHKDSRTGEPTKETVVNKAGKTLASNVYTYDAVGNVESRSILNGNNVELARTLYTWSGGLLISSETNDRSGKRISSSENSYDNDGNLINQVFKNASGAITRNITTKWQNGLEVETQQFSAEGTLQLKITNEYGSEGEVLKRTVENYQGKSKQIREFEYDYRPNRGRT